MNNIEVLNLLIKEMKEFYSDEDNDDFFLLKIDNEEWLILKSQGITFLDAILNDIRTILFDKEIDFIKMKKICTCLNRFCSYGYEMSVYRRMLERIENILLNNVYNISNIEKYIQNIQERYTSVINQCNAFDNFKHNQNKFDNMISIIKILQRLESASIKISFNSMFLNTEEDNSDYYKNLIKEEFFKEFSGLRFMI